MIHSKAYHRYFEGYTEVYAEGKMKGRSIRRIYTGEYYRQCGTDSIWRRDKLCSAALFAGALTLYLVASVQHVEANRCTVVAITQMLALLSFFWLAYALIPLLLARRELRIGEYKGRISLLSASALTALFCIASGCCSAGFSVGHGQLQFRPLCSAAMLCVCGLLLACLHVHEKRIKFLRVENQKTAPAEGFDICSAPNGAN